ncbi:hypothetical protein [Pseudactinotalea sp.]|uniref:hypothetical protein n=1 Tax=Pseudactinotalea sp. TaxID=1926260 RepID=UPI003B3BA14F
MIVKHGDTHEVSWRANMDLTGATVRLIARDRGRDPEVLGCDITDAEEGTVTHTLTGTLPTGSYRIELEVTINGEIITFPNDAYALLTVLPDLD